MGSTIISRLVLVSVILALALVVVTGPLSGVATSQAATPYTPSYTPYTSYAFNDDDADDAAPPSIEPNGLRDLPADEAGIGADIQEPRELTAKPIRSPFLEDLPYMPSDETAAARPARRSHGATKSAYAAKGKTAAPKAIKRSAKSSVSAAWQPRTLKSAKTYSPLLSNRRPGMFNRGRQPSQVRKWWE